ncbi:hypothetical protein K461DRAFT_319914 [Myriangium duriaei CBS 260.36]|uniref:Uncharacterized protein n=1 Tax=Myriangium duriaei CBS 260.36 TaxID=1168546 RepID=A0A9P4J7A7_9PEZI|nr:hypothetical protein K461DRAFT_319914 [Myriangium duriaei CBS 260.36]
MALLPILSSRILSCVDYNDLPDADDRLDLPTPFLATLGALFIEHNVNKAFGLTVLNKHFELQAGEVMVHEGRICCPRTSIEGLVGHSFFLNDSNFQAYEYQDDTPSLTSPPKAFLVELRSILVDSGLQNLLALTRIDPDLPRSLEACGPNRTHISVPVRDDMSLTPKNTTGTTWRFERFSHGGLGIMVVSVRKKNTDSP